MYVYFLLLKSCILKLKDDVKKKAYTLGCHFAVFQTKWKMGCKHWILEKDSAIQHTGMKGFWLCKMFEIIVFQNGESFLMENCILKIMNQWLHTNEDSKDEILFI